MTCYFMIQDVAMIDGINSVIGKIYVEGTICYFQITILPKLV